MNPVPDRQVWRLPIGTAPSLRNWDGDIAAFNPLSGHTHILDMVAGDVVQTISVEPRTSMFLCARIADLLDLPLDDALQTQVGQVLAQLDELGLIEPYPA